MITELHSVLQSQIMCYRVRFCIAESESVLEESEWVVLCNTESDSSLTETESVVCTTDSDSVIQNLTP